MIKIQTPHSQPLPHKFSLSTLITLLLPILLTTFPATAEASFFDSMKETYHNVESQVKQASTKEKYNA